MLFTIGALSSVLFGLGNGAVFKLVAEYYPAKTGAVTGVVGAAGGLGGFFLRWLGVVRDATGSYTLGFIFLAIFAIGCLLVNALFVRRHLRRGRDVQTEGRVR